MRDNCAKQWSEHSQEDILVFLVDLKSYLVLRTWKHTGVDKLQSGKSEIQSTDSTNSSTITDTVESQIFITAAMSRAQSSVRDQTVYINTIIGKLVEITDAIRDLTLQISEIRGDPIKNLQQTTSGKAKGAVRLDGKPHIYLRNLDTRKRKISPR